jgi:hypothetical protein
MPFFIVTAVKTSNLTLKFVVGHEDDGHFDKQQEQGGQTI